MNPIRHLSVEDLIILQGLSEGKRLHDISDTMHLTQPAISQRLSKIKSLYDKPVYHKVGRVIELTEFGQSIANRANLALGLLLGPDLSEGSGSAFQKPLRIGTRPEVGMSWIGPTVMKLRRQSPQTTYHLHFGSGRELIRELQEGRIDALLTSAPITTEEFESLELAKESYVFVGSQQHAKSVRTPAHLSEVTLIEHDPSFPFLRYVAPSLRARMKFKDVWFLGSTRLMATAVLEGLGVSILPLYLVANDIRSGSIHSLDIDIGKANDHFRLLFLKNSGLKSRLAPLAEGLISNRLTN